MCEPLKDRRTQRLDMKEDSQVLKPRVDLEMYWQRGWEERRRKGALSRMWNQKRFLQKLSNHPKMTHILPQIQKMDAMTSSHISWQHEITIKMLWTQRRTAQSQSLWKWWSRRGRWLTVSWLRWLSNNEKSWKVRAREPCLAYNEELFFFLPSRPEWFIKVRRGG